VRPVTTIGLDDPEAVRPPVFDVTVYEVIDAPPVDAGAVNATEVCPLLAVAVPIVGAPGTTAETVKDLLTRVAELKVPSPTWSALMVHVPTVTNASTPPAVIVHTPEVDEVKATVRLESEVALSDGVVPKLFAPGSVNVIDCESFGVTLDDAAEALPVPMLFVAVTVKV
jgi:hypothetical protein